MADTFNAKFLNDDTFGAKFGDTTFVSTDDYEKLYNHPYLNDHKIIGHKLSEDYGLQDKMQEATVAEIEAILYLD